MKKLVSNALKDFILKIICAKNVLIINFAYNVAKTNALSAS